jgi:hypothetical protein
MILGVSSRLFPHFWNVTPITAIVLFASVYFGLRWAAIALFVIMGATDLFIGFYEWPIMVTVYGSFLLVIVVGWVLNKNLTTTRIFVAAVASSVIFYLVTNWAVWQFGTMYEHSIAGLVECYIAALPFFRNSLVGDLLYTSGLFGSAHVFGFFANKKMFGSETKADAII